MRFAYVLALLGLVALACVVSSLGHSFAASLSPLCGGEHLAMSAASRACANAVASVERVAAATPAPVRGLIKKVTSSAQDIVLELQRRELRMAMASPLRRK